MSWLLASLTLVIPLRFRSNPALLVACWATLAVRHVAALINCTVTLIPMAEEDARTFNLTAQGLRTDPTYHPYVACLHKVYHYLGCDDLLGCELSILAFSLSLVVFVRLVEWRGYGHRAPALVLVFGLWPAGVLATSVTLRESFQMLLVLTATWSIVRRAPIPAMLSLALLTQLHNGLAVFALALAVLAALSRPWPGVPLALGLATVLLTHPPASSPATSSLTGGTLLSEAATYRQGVPAGRKTYRAPLDTSSAGGFLTTFPRVLGSYMFAPLPGSPADWYGWAESALRMLLCVGVVLGARRDRRLLVLLIFVMLESLWAVGTSNWGQAIRHRVVASGLLVALGAGYWLGGRRAR